MQQRKHDAGRNACSHREDDDRGHGRKDQHELAESVPRNRDDLSQAHDTHCDEDQNARECGQRDMCEKRRAVTGHAKDKHDCHEPRELAASSRLGDNLGQWRAGVDGKGAKEARH